MLDAIIVGGGLSGLSLAARLASMGSTTRRVLLIDNGEQDVQRRAWGFWATHPGWVAAAVSASWSTMCVETGTARIVKQLSPMRYWYVRGDVLQTVALARFAAAGGETVIADVGDVVDDDTCGLVVVNGHPLEARWIFDSRPPTAPASPISMSFLGYHVSTARPAFDPREFTLMDLRVAGGDGVAFAYVLPTSDRDALVEVVGIGRSATVTERDMERYLSDVRGIDSWALTGPETGCLPLDVPAQQPGRHVVPIGRRAGMLKPSTGYAFTRIQRHSSAICSSLQAHGHPFAVQPPQRRYSWMDAALLEVVRTDPDAIAPTFARMFAHNDARTILHFLDEEAGAADLLRIVRSMPPTPFLRAAAPRSRVSA